MLESLIDELQIQEWCSSFSFQIGFGSLTESEYKDKTFLLQDSQTHSFPYFKDAVALYYGQVTVIFTAVSVVPFY